MKGDPFTRDLFRWLDQVRDDAVLNGSDFKLAYVIGGYVNRGTGDAWPSLAELAERHGTSRRTVWTCLKALQRRGHLAIESGGGRHCVSHYRPVILAQNNVKPASSFPAESVKPASPFPASETVQFDVEKGAEQRQKSGSLLHPEPSEEPTEEPSEGENPDLLGDSPSKKSSSKKETKRSTAMPNSWPSAADLAWARGHWNDAGRADLIDRIDAEAARARDHHAAKGSKFLNWSAAWRNWSRNAVEFSKASPQGGRTRPASALEGVNRIIAGGSPR